MRRFALSVAILCALPSTAHAATVLGDTTTPPNGRSYDRYVVGQRVAGNGKTYTVPSQGVITQVGTVAKVPLAVGTGTARFLVLRGSDPMKTVIGHADIGVDTATTQRYALARIPVLAGDALAIYLGKDITQYAYENSDAVVFGARQPADVSIAPTDGGSVETEDLPRGTSDANLLISATLEPDADGDGYGDDSQDSCPAIATIHAGACATNLQVTAADPVTVAPGQLATLTTRVTETANAAAPGATAGFTVPSDLELVSATAAGKDCGGTDCPLGDMPVGESRDVTVTVRAKRAGTSVVAFRAATTLAETRTDDNAAGTAVTAAEPGTATPTGQTPSPTASPVPTATAEPAIRLCTVPKLKGKTRSKAKAALVKAGCKTGTIRGKKGRVRSQTIPAKVRVVAGTKVGFRLKR